MPDLVVLFLSLPSSHVITFQICEHERRSRLFDNFDPSGERKMTLNGSVYREGRSCPLARENIEFATSKYNLKRQKGRGLRVSPPLKSGAKASSQSAKSEDKKTVRKGG